MSSSPQANNVRVCKEVPIRLPHEIVYEIMQSKPDMLDHRTVDPDDFNVSSLRDHPLIKEFGFNNCVPIGLYSDATPVFKGHSMIAGSMNILWSRRRFILYALLKDSGHP
jgi:hypothetical protein